jgi:DNA modification methylase
MLGATKIEWRSVETLIPYAKNARTHSDEQVAQIAGSIKEFGFNNPVLVDKDNSVIAGHGRLMAARKLGMEKVPVVELEHLTESQRKAYVLADNRIALNSGWDTSMLSLELQDLKDDIDLSLLGFDPDELDALLNPIEETEGITDEDAVPDVPDEPKTKLGDIYILGNHRLMCGDSTSIDDVDKLMDGQKADICFTSPPYNAGSLDIKGNARTQKKYNSFDDNQTEDEYKDFVISNLNCIFSVCNEVLYNIGLVEGNKRVIVDVLAHYREQFKDIIYWKKNNVAPHIQGGVINNLVEFILCFGDGKRKFQNAQFTQGSYYNVIEGSSAAGNEFSKIHKATFPTYLPENIIQNFCPVKGSILDTFGGTGTTMIAAEKLGRKSYLMELDPKYCDVIVQRWEEFTGKKAVLSELEKA